MNFDEKIVKKRAAARFPPTVSCRLAFGVEAKIVSQFPKYAKSLFPLLDGQSHATKKTHSQVLYLL